VQSKAINVAQVLLAMGLVAVLANYTTVNPLEAVPGLLILCAIALAGWLLSNIEAMPIKLPAVAYAGLLAILLTIPGVPGSEWIVAQTGKLNFILIATALVGYAGIGLGLDVLDLAKDSWKYAIMTVLIMAGTYFGSAIVAHVILSAMGQI
jgi:hypothetical protein